MTETKTLQAIKDAAVRAVIRHDAADFANGENGWDWIDAAGEALTAIAGKAGENWLIAVTMIEAGERFAVHYIVEMNGEEWAGHHETGRVYTH